MAKLSAAQMRMGVQAFGGITDFMIGGIQADMNEAAQAHANAMRELASASARNQVTQAEVQIRDKSQRLSVALQQQEIRDRGAAEVSAAAAGVEGGSVEQAMLGLRRSAMQAQHARMRNRDANLLAQDTQRNNIQLATVLGEDISVIPRPSAASAMLGLGAQLIQTYDENQPEGSRFADSDRRVSDWFR